MTPPVSRDERIAKMLFSSIYPHYVEKVLKKGKTEQDLRKVITWLTGHSSAKIDQHIKAESTFETFFREAKLHPNVGDIKGVVCGRRVEDIKNPLTKKVTYLDKLIDELARGKKMSSILRP